MKTLVIILHHNTVDYTNTLYEMLKPYERNDYDVVVLDNGSDEGKSSKYTTYRLDENTGYGGGLDVSMQLFIDNKEYDSFAFLNSDLIIHGYNFFKELRKQLFSDDKLMILSPCVIQSSKEQVFWKQMHCWNSIELRYVPILDWQFVIMKREFVEKQKSFNSRYGWVQDVVAALTCEQNGWKMAVCDWLPIVHVGGGTVKQNPHLSNYSVMAKIEMDEYFRDKNLTSESNRLHGYVFNYEYKLKD